MSKKTKKDEIETISEEEKKEPKNAHGIQFNLNVNSKDADVIREALINAGHVHIAETFETKRELTIMHEFWDAKKKGENIFEVWRKGNYYESIDTKEPKYKMKHRVLNATKG